MPRRAIHWPAQAMLLVADLHWGKSETFQRAGLGVPTGALREDQGELHRLVRATRAERVVVLGDLLHAASGLTDEVIEEISAFTAALDGRFECVAGNHDKSLLERLGPTGPAVHGDELEVAGLRLVHEAEPAASAPSVCGHLHPVASVGTRRERVRCPCFAVEGNRLVLPSFGTFTGGYKVSASARRRLFLATPTAVIPWND